MKNLCLFTLLLSFSSLAIAKPIHVPVVINFEQYPEYTQITYQYAYEGAIFINALQLVAPYYDYFDYPPHSGSGVITNDPNDPIQINIYEPDHFSIVGFWYAAPGGIVADFYNQFGNLMASVNGRGTNGTDDEILFSNGHCCITKVTISANLGADYETADDLRLDIDIPEPGSFVLLSSGLLAVAGVLRRRFGARLAQW